MRFRTEWTSQGDLQGKGDQVTTVAEVIEELNKYETTSELEAFFLEQGIMASIDGGTKRCLVAKYISERTGGKYVSVGYCGSYVSLPDRDLRAEDRRVLHSDVLRDFIEVFDLGGWDDRLYEVEEE
jgi:hypothetical protein